MLLSICVLSVIPRFYFRFALYRFFISSRNFPAPRTTQVSGFSARITGTPVSLLIYLSSPLRRDPPPVITIPLSTISAASSGGVFSRACLTPSRICSTGSFNDFLISTESISRVLGRPEWHHALQLHCLNFLFGEYITKAELNLFRHPFTYHKVILCLMYLIIASSNSSPAILSESAITIPPRDITAISVVPPPISTIMWPAGSWIGIFAPIAAARASSMRNISRAPACSADSRTALFSTSVIPEGTPITTLGLTRVFLL